jgi:hypothetical protein
MLAETGTVGLALFLAVIVGAVASAAGAARRFERAGERVLAHVSRGVLVAMLGLLTAAVFISAQGVPMFWVLLMLGPILLRIASGRNHLPRKRPHRGGGGGVLRAAAAQGRSA